MQRFTPGNLGFTEVSAGTYRLASPRGTLIHPRFPPDSPCVDLCFSLVWNGTRCGLPLFESCTSASSRVWQEHKKKTNMHVSSQLETCMLVFFLCSCHTVSVFPLFGMELHGFSLWGASTPVTK